MQTLQTEIYGFVLSFAAGIAIATVLDLTGRWRRAHARRVLPAVVADSAAVLAIGGLAVITLLLATWGQLRGYVFLGAALGCLFFYVTVGRVSDRSRGTRLRGMGKFSQRLPRKSRRIQMNREYP